jgi:protein-L-isoaspartate(D-aspartate) O-methyltransferase
MATHPETESRQAMVHDQIYSRGISDPQVLAAMEAVPRHLFLPEELRHEAYRDCAVAIGEGQTISQPFMVALMTEILELQGDERVLEVGTGSGYQTALLAEIAAKVYTIEIVETLARRAAGVFRTLGYGNICQKVGDAYLGWPEAAPFERIIVTAAPDHVPPALVAQLDPRGGRMVIPVGDEAQELKLIVRRGEHFETRDVLSVSFVPMTGEARRR